MLYRKIDDLVHIMFFFVFTRITSGPDYKVLNCTMASKGKGKVQEDASMLSVCVAYSTLIKLSHYHCYILINTKSYIVCRQF
jgi:hypothetical protein